MGAFFTPDRMEIPNHHLGVDKGRPSFPGPIPAFNRTSALNRAGEKHDRVFPGAAHVTAFRGIVNRSTALACEQSFLMQVRHRTINSFREFLESATVI